MKKNGILNSDISALLSQLRHTDQIIIGDAGLPVPAGVLQIDLALELGLPSFSQVLKLIESEMLIESFVIASEMAENNPKIYDETLTIMANRELSQVSHEEFKTMSRSVKAVIRTGEDTPYANIILQSACLF